MHQNDDLNFNPWVLLMDGTIAPISDQDVMRQLNTQNPNRNVLGRSVTVTKNGKQNGKNTNIFTYGNFCYWRTKH